MRGSHSPTIGMWSCGPACVRVCVLRCGSDQGSLPASSDSCLFCSPRLHPRAPSHGGPSCPAIGPHWAGHGAALMCPHSVLVLPRGHACLHTRTRPPPKRPGDPEGSESESSSEEPAPPTEREVRGWQGTHQAAPVGVWAPSQRGRCTGRMEARCLPMAIFGSAPHARLVVAESALAAPPSRHARACTGPVRAIVPSLAGSHGLVRSHWRRGLGEEGWMGHERPHLRVVRSEMRRREDARDLFVRGGGGRPPASALPSATTPAFSFRSTSAVSVGRCQCVHFLASSEGGRQAA